MISGARRPPIKFFSFCLSENNPSSRNSNKSGGFRIRIARRKSVHVKITPTIRGVDSVSSRTDDMAIEHSLEVLRDQVELEVDQVFSMGDIEIGLCFGVRDNPDRETFLRYVRDREADSV